MHMSLHIVLSSYAQWQFLSRDEGEIDTQHDPSWIEDEGKSQLNAEKKLCMQAT